MAIHVASAPPTGLAAVKADLLLTTDIDMVADGVLELVRAPRIDAFPIFTAELEDVLYDRGLLRSARATSWYYVVFKGDKVDSIQEVVQGRVLPQVSRQSAAVGEAVFKAVDEAHMLDEVKHADYQLRILRVPELYFLAAWLHSDREDLLLPIPPVTRDLVGVKKCSEKQVVEALKPIAEIRFNTPDDRMEQSSHVAMEKKEAPVSGTSSRLSFPATPIAAKSRNS